MLRLPNLQPISMPTPQLQYHQQQQQYNPLNFLASGYLPAPFINTGQPNAPSFVYSAPTATRGYADGASTTEEALLSRSRPQLAPITTRPVAQGLPIPQPTGERLAPSPRRRSIPSETSPLPSETSPTTGESGNEERVESPTPFINKVRLSLCHKRTYGGQSDDLGNLCSFTFSCRVRSTTASGGPPTGVRSCLRQARQSSSPHSPKSSGIATPTRLSGSSIYVRCSCSALASVAPRADLVRNARSADNFKRLGGVELHDALAGSAPSPHATSEYTGFTHSLFFRDAPGRRCDLGKIKPTKGKHYSAARRSSAGSVGGAGAGAGAGAGGANKAHILRGKGKVGGSVPVEGAERKYSVSG